jgi:hypothetical protein
VVPCSSFGAVPLQIPLMDVLRAAGETLSPLAEPNVLAWPLRAWSRMQVPASAEIGALVALVPNATWRVLLDGTVWVGFETWPTFKLSDDDAQTHSEPEKNRLTIAPANDTAPSVLPGMALSYSPPGFGQQIKNVSYVRHDIRPTQIRTLVLFE